MDFSLTPEEKELQQRVRQLAEEQITPIAAAVDESSRVSPELMGILADANLLRYTVPEEYGGYGIKVVNLCIIREELARVCGQADTNFIMQGLGSYPITLGGPTEQKARYLPPIARGEAIAAFALTEPQAGSDVIGMTTSAVVENEEWVLNGQKKFISQAGDASTYTVFAKTPGGGQQGYFGLHRGAGHPRLRRFQADGLDGSPSHRRASVRKLPPPLHQPDW